ncbi:MAG: hypothetical protein KKE57_06035 [Proteobacteria bacterium]|nr:hypothetical protein [Pseudomonadota bacterium]
MDSSFAYLFRGLDEGQMKKIMAVGKEIPMKKGEQIFREGQEANGVEDCYHSGGTTFQVLFPLENPP